ncbi:MAG: transposase [Thermoanaerobaculia bacterium]|nr:transposase [Thermoanaerobaculia bacterium]
MKPRIVGIDVVKDRLDVHVRPAAETFAVARDGKGLEALVAALRDRNVALVVLEATGGFELTVAAALAGAGLPLAVVNPRQIRDFARATGRVAKTAALDAEAIARFAEAIRPEPRPLASEHAQALSELVARRRQLVEMIGMEKNRSRQARARRVQKSLVATLRVLEAPARRARPRHRRRGARLHGRAVTISSVFAGQRLGLREVDADVWLVSFMHYDLGYIDLEACTLQTIDTPFGSRVSPR